MSEQKPEQVNEQTPQASGDADPASKGRDKIIRSSRRRFLTGGAVVAPAILTLKSRPAMATVCTYSGHMSLTGTVVPGTNIKQRDYYDCAAKAPEMWKISCPGGWPSGCPTIKFKDKFNYTCQGGQWDSTFQHVIMNNYIDGIDCHAVAAWLNAYQFGSTRFGYTCGEIENYVKSGTCPTGAGNTLNFLKTINRPPSYVGASET